MWAPRTRRGSSPGGASGRPSRRGTPGTGSDDIDRPTLVLHGTDDRLVPVENARRVASLIPGARLVLLEGAGHVYHSEQPEAADAAVLSFLDDVEARV